MSDVVSTGAVAPGERVDFWRWVMSEAFVPLEVGELDAEGFTGSIRTENVGDLMIAELSSQPQQVRRTRRMIADSDSELLQIGLGRVGSACLTQDGRDVVLGPGDLTVYETSRPFRWTLRGDWEATVFTLPRAAVGLSSAESSALTARLLPGGTGLTAVVSRFLRDLADNAGAVSPTQSRRIVNDIVDLVLAVAADRIDGAAACAPGTLVLRIKDHIDRHLSDPALSPATIAAAQHISTRYLHKLFAEQDTSVSGYLRRQRLRRCARDLLDPALSRHPIAAIARRAGFGDLSGFGRAFRATYGMTPREYRCCGVTDLR